MSEKESGGPAFPRPYSEKYSDERHHAQTGMTLRDYFAAKAMPALLIEMHQTGMAPIKGIAAIAYEMADAMLEARKQ